MHLFKVELGGIEPWMWAGDGDLNRLQKSWTQQPAHWTLFFLDHAGVMSINNRPIPFQPRSVGFVPPGTKVSFDRIGEGTYHHSLTFGLVARAETVVIPAMVGPDQFDEARRRELEESYDWLHITIMRGAAFAYNFLWSIARPIDQFRKSDLIYDAEALIMKRIAAKISVKDLSDSLAISQSHLLRLFRQEHGCTIQEYIRDKRIELAAQMITDTAISIKEIAVRVGIPDLQYFNKLIRSSAGMSPSALREQALNRTRH